MQNMSYCRFENTLAALRECEDALDENKDEYGDPLANLSAEEFEAAEQLIQLCRRIGKDFNVGKDF